MTGDTGALAGLLTDRYELTMLQGALRDGAAGRRCVFEVFARRLPPGRRYGVLAGTGRLLDLLAAFRFDGADVDFLRAEGVVDGPTADWLAGYRFIGDVHGYGEGEVYFGGSPVLVVEGTFAECVLLETVVLSVLNHDSAVAAAAARMVSAAGGRPIVEMGSRRVHEEAAVAAARAAWLAGFATTSNLAAGRRYGVPTAGTSAHAFVLVHEDERAAFQSQVESAGVGTTLLVDTYDVPTAVRTAVEAAGPGLGAVRIDSGDLALQAHQVRRLLDSLGNQQTRIVVTGDLDEHGIAALAASPADAYGVGTSVATGSGAPTAGFVYKLVARADDDGTMVPVAKRSTGKPTVAGRKWAVREYEHRGGRPVARAEHVLLADPGDDTGLIIGAAAAGSTTGRVLQRALVRAGTVVGSEPLSDARQRCAASLAELPADATRLSHGPPALATMMG